MSGRILVVEDDADVADYVAKGLRETGYTVEHVGDGRDGLYLASSSSFDAIVMDRMLPGMDGLSVVKALRAAQVETPILILSALGQLDERVNRFAGRRRRLPDQAVRLFRTSCADRKFDPPKGRQVGRDGAALRRP